MSLHVDPTDVQSERKKENVEKSEIFTLYCLYIYLFIYCEYAMIYFCHFILKYITIY